MSKQKQAFSTGVIGIALLAGAMILFYYFSDRFRKSENDLDLSQNVEPVVEEKSEFAGIYSPSDGAMEAGEKRIAYFIVNRREEGGYLGSVKVDTIGSSDHVFVPCMDVKIEASEFFVSCLDQNEGSISLNGSWTKSPEGIRVQAKVLWTKAGELLLDLQRSFRHMPGS